MMDSEARRNSISAIAGEKYLLKLLCMLAAVCAGYIYSLPSPIDPLPYKFPKSPPKLIGTLRINQKLQLAQRAFEGLLIGAESFTVDDKGHIYTGTHDGAIWRLNDESHAEIISRTGIKHIACGHPELEPSCGRVQGIKYHANGFLYAADTYKGLLQINVTNGDIRTVLTGMEDIPFRFVNGLEIAADGVIYMTDSSSKWSRREYAYEVLEMNALGRLVSHNPSTGENKLLLNGLYMAAGVCISPDESYILVSEMSRCQIRRYYIAGPRKGISDVFIDNLPGYPDNIKNTSRGTFLVGFPSARFEGSSPFGSFLDNISPFPSLKRFIAKMTPFWIYRAVIPRHAILLEINTAGNIVNSFHDPSGSVITSGMSEAFEYNNKVYIGHFSHPYIGILSASNLFS